MTGHSRHRYDVFTDAGRRERGDMYLLFHNVSPSQAFGVHTWLIREGWACEVKDTDGELKHGLSERRHA